MFGLFKVDPSKKLEKAYQEKLRAAMAAQRSGDIKLFSELTEKADAIRKELEKLEQASP